MAGHYKDAINLYCYTELHVKSCGLKPTSNVSEVNLHVLNIELIIFFENLSALFLLCLVWLAERF